MALSLSDEEFQRKLQSMPSLAEKNAKKHQPACLSKSAAMISATNGRIDSQVINSPEEKYITGESVIVDEIDKSGARMLMANKMQSELAFAVTRTDVVAFRQTDYILQEQPYEHTQYCFDLLVDFLNNTAACRTRSAVALPSSAGGVLHRAATLCAADAIARGQRAACRPRSVVALFSRAGGGPRRTTAMCAAAGASLEMRKPRAPPS